MAVHAWHVQIEEDNVWPYRVGVRLFAMQKQHRLNAVFDVMQRVVNVSASLANSASVGLSSTNRIWIGRPSSLAVGIKNLYVEG